MPVISTAQETVYLGTVTLKKNSAVTVTNNIKFQHNVMVKKLMKSMDVQKGEYRDYFTSVLGISETDAKMLHVVLMSIP